MNGTNVCIRIKDDSIRAVILLICNVGVSSGITLRAYDGNVLVIYYLLKINIYDGVESSCFTLMSAIKVQLYKYVSEKSNSWTTFGVRPTLKPRPQLSVRRFL